MLHGPNTEYRMSNEGHSSLDTDRYGYFKLFQAIFRYFLIVYRLFRGYKHSEQTKLIY